MNYRPIYILAVTLFVMAGIISCKKKSNSNPYGNSLIATIKQSHEGAVLLYRIVYNSDNSVDSIIVNGDTSSYSTGYTGFSAFDYSYSSFTINQNGLIYTVDIDANDNITKVLQMDTLTMIYNGTEIAEQQTWLPTNVYPYYQLSIDNFSWQNGNVTEDSVAGAPSYTYVYNNSKPGQPGDAWRIEQFLTYGRSYIKTNNLPTEKMANGTWSEQYFYETDGSGRITQLTRVGNNNGYSLNDTVVYDYTYY